MKEYNYEYPKSIALTLRMTENYHNTGRVLIADSWFGSVACAIALFRVGLFCVMNVKTATKNYPKNELMSKVGEIKGKTDLARKERRDRQGKSLAFTQDVSVGKKGTLTLLAAGLPQQEGATPSNSDRNDHAPWQDPQQNMESKSSRWGHHTAQSFDTPTGSARTLPAMDEHRRHPQQTAPGSRQHGRCMGHRLVGEAPFC